MCFSTVLDDMEKIRPWLKSFDASFADLRLQKRYLAQLRTLREYLAAVGSEDARRTTAEQFFKSVGAGDLADAVA